MLHLVDGRDNLIVLQMLGKCLRVHNSNELPTTSRTAAAKTTASARKTSPSPTTTATAKSAAGTSRPAGSPILNPAAITPISPKHDDDQKENKYPYAFCDTKVVLNLATMVFVNRCPRSLVFPLRRRQDRLHPGRQAAVEISRLEPRSYLLVNNSFAQRIGQDSFQTITYFYEKGVILYEDK